MPSKKKKYNARFPAGRIKKIMQSDEEIGKVAQAVPVIISKTLELFIETLLKKSVKITNSRNSRTLSTSHMKQCIMSEGRFDFLRDLVKNVPDISAAEETNVGPETDSDSTTDQNQQELDTTSDFITTKKSNDSASNPVRDNDSKCLEEELKTDHQNLNGRRVNSLKRSESQDCQRRGPKRHTQPAVAAIEYNRKRRPDNTLSSRYLNIAPTKYAHSAPSSAHTDLEVNGKRSAFDFSTQPVINIDLTNIDVTSSNSNASTASVSTAAAAAAAATTAATTAITVSNVCSTPDNTTPVNLVSSKSNIGITHTNTNSMSAMSSAAATTTASNNQMNAFLQLDEDYDDI